MKVTGAIYDVAVVGGGVIGLSSAFQLATEGHSVVVFDDDPGSGSSLAAAGMLAPGGESTPEHQSFASQTIGARLQWPSFAKRIGDISGCSIELREVGSVFVAWDASDQRELARYFLVAAGQGIESKEVRRDDSRELFVGLSPRIETAHYVTGDAYVDPDQLIGALLEALAALGVTLVRERAVNCFEKEELAVVETPSRRFEARKGIIATGYSAQPLDLLSTSSVKLRPVRGVTLRLLSSPDPCVRPMIRGIVRGRLIYVIRRPDGVVVVGATSDESSVAVVETRAIRQLLEDATELVPQLNEASFIEARVGLRPAAATQLPFFESLGTGTWAWSSGHFRHGFLLAPVAAADATNFVNRVA